MFIYRLGFMLFGFLVLPMFFLAGCSGEHVGRSGFVLPKKHVTALTREEHKGKILYGYYCALCHGEKGEGDGFNSFSLDTPPANHTDATLMATLSDTQIQMVIREGGSALGRSPQMPPWGKVVTDSEISHLTAFIRTLAKPSEDKESN